jgi:hypothetical protein
MAAKIMHRLPAKRGAIPGWTLTALREWPTITSAHI